VSAIDDAKDLLAPADTTQGPRPKPKPKHVVHAAHKNCPEDVMSEEWRLRKYDRVDIGTLPVGAWVLTAYKGRVKILFTYIPWTGRLGRRSCSKGGVVRTTGGNFHPECSVVWLDPVGPGPAPPRFAFKIR